MKYILQDIVIHTQNHEIQVRHLCATADLSIGFFLKKTSCRVSGKNMCTWHFKWFLRQPM